MIGSDSSGGGRGPRAGARALGLIASAGGGDDFVTFVAQRWLHDAPGGPLTLGEEGAGAALGALAAGWSSTIVHTLAAQPSTFHQLERSIGGIGRVELRERLGAMRRAGLIEPRPSDGEGAIYTVTDWLRAGIAPLIAAARVERRDPGPGMAPIEALDVGATFLLTLPLLTLPSALSGACRLEVELDGEEDGERQPRATGATAWVDACRVTSCELRLDPEAAAWATGDAGGWLDSVIDPSARGVRTGGQSYLGGALLESLHQRLFGIQAHPPSRGCI